MREIGGIKAAYDWFVGEYGNAVRAAIEAGDTEVLDRLGERRDVVERGFFVLLFGQFENDVNEHFVSGRDQRVSNPDWRVRRGWDVPAFANHKRVPFESKLAAVVDRNVPEHGSMLNAYQLRNHCAHGGMSNPVGSIDDFISDLQVWSAMLRR